MTAQETNLLNAFETTLNATAGASDLTFTVNTVTDAASNTLTAPCYLVINPDSATNREVILVTSINAGTKTLTCDNINKRFLTGSAATSGLSHSSGAVVRVSPVQQHIEDLNDRVDTIINEAGTAVNTSLFLDEDDMSSDSATKGVTQQSVKAYVDSQVTAQDLDFRGDSNTGTPSVDLDSQNFTIAGTANEIETSASGQTLTIGLPSTITTTLSATSVLSDGVTATTQSANDNSTKVATTAYVDAQVTAEDLDTAGNSGTGSVDLDTQSLTVSGDGTILTSTASGQDITFAIADASTSAKGAASFSSDNFAVSSGAVTIKDSGVSNDELAGSIANAKLANSSITVSDSESTPNTSPVALGGTLTFAGTANEVTVLESAGTITISLPATINANTTGNAATATALETARTIGGVSFDGTGDINLPGVNTAGNQNTSGTAAGLSATLVIGSGGTGQSSYTAGDVIYYASGTSFTKLGIGSAGQVLTVNSGGNAPEWQTSSTGFELNKTKSFFALNG